jgi:uncharacterized membrane protein
LLGSLIGSSFRQAVAIQAKKSSTRMFLMLKNASDSYTLAQFFIAFAFSSACVQVVKLVKKTG